MSGDLEAHLDNDAAAPPMSRPRVAAGALFFDESGRVLLVNPTYKARWDIPGGYVEPGETPYEACAREVEEELGLSVSVGRLLAVDWAPSPEEGDKVLFVFDGGILTPKERRGISLASTEIGSATYFDPLDIDDALTERLSRRVRQAITARAHEACVYLENGIIKP